MRTIFSISAGLTAALLITGALAQDKGGKGKGKGGGIQLPPMIKMSITGFADGGRVPTKNSCAGSPSPAISWTGGVPATTQSYALILHDPDPVLGGSASNDVLHWAIFDIPGDANGLPEALPNMAELPSGAKQLNGITGQPGYFGPCAPPGHGDHHYTFEIWGLNAKLGLPASTSRADLMKAMDGKVVAKGVYIGIFGQL